MASMSAPIEEGVGNDNTFNCARDYQLFGPGPKRVLALDGGGVRGAITIAFLERIEALLSQHQGRPVRLCDHFHLVGGASAGAIIGAALALGFKASELKALFMRLAPLAFVRKRSPIPLLNTKFDLGGLREEIEKIVADRELQSDDLATGLCVISKRIDTGSPWILSNNPSAPYWNDGPGHDGNKHVKLANIVRASTASHEYYDPELVAISRKKSNLPLSIAKPMQRPFLTRLAQAVMERIGLWSATDLDLNEYGLFVDAGMSPHNNPSLALLQMVALRPYGLAWTPGPDHLSLVSVGTGRYTPRSPSSELAKMRKNQQALLSVESLMHDLEGLVLQQMQYLGECQAPWPSGAIAGMRDDDVGEEGKFYRFVRYDVELESTWLKEKLGLDVPQRDVARYRSVDDPGIVADIYEIAKAAAERQVKLEHLLAART
jgi:hypothetical protein